MTILVTGGAGYIGSHIVHKLIESGHQVIVIDDLSTGNLNRLNQSPIEIIDLAEDIAVPSINKILKQAKVTSVIHLAAKKSAPESVSKPEFYYKQNIGGLSNLLLALTDSDVENFVFSSSCSVYGDAKGLVTEKSIKHPVSPYGETKLFGEALLERVSFLGKLRVASLRYFNVAGAASKELADRAVANLIPMAIEKILEGRPPLVFGNDYDTPDGSCIRDYIHVEDLADAHIAALGYLHSSDASYSSFNIGTGTGSSVFEVLSMLSEVSKVDFTPTILDRRAGDPAYIVADADLAKKDLGWEPKLGLREMVASAWDSMITG